MRCCPGMGQGNGAHRSRGERCGNNLNSAREAMQRWVITTRSPDLCLARGSIPPVVVSTPALAPGCSGNEVSSTPGKVQSVPTVQRMHFDSAALLK